MHEWNVEAAVNPKTGQAVTARRRRLARVLELAVRDEYGVFVAGMVAAETTSA